ncbi:MAG: NAD(+) synthase [Candidatus Nanoarchaeia archaeon]
MEKIKLPYLEPEKAVDEIGNFIFENIKKVNGTGAVIGLSGGVDSTTVAAIANNAFYKYNKLGNTLKLVGYLLPSSVNAKEDTSDGELVAKKLGIEYHLINIQPIVDAHIQVDPDIAKNQFHKGNLMSRIRANVLSTKSAIEKKPILGTGNKDEDFGIGYYTLFGDGAVHMSPIGNLSKRLVKDIARYFGFEKIANREPTAGLEPNQTDLKDLGYSYETVELVLEGKYQGLSLFELVRNPQINELIEKTPVKKFSKTKEIIEDILRRHYEIALPKAQLLHPPIAPLTLSYK